MIWSAGGVDADHDLGVDDRLMIAQGINGLAELTLDELRARVSLEDRGAWIDLGGGNGVRLLGIDASALESLIEHQTGWL